MRLMILADGNSVHTIRWVNALAEQGVEIFLISLSPIDKTKYPKSIKTLSLQMDFSRSQNKGIWEKINYFRLRKPIKQYIREFKPDILHAYYASSYGLLGALSCFKPFVISVWGSDVFEFPQLGKIQERILRFNLKKASTIQSTSLALSKETQKYTSKKIHLIPFGIDTDKFFPQNTNDEYFTVGTIKGMRDIYGIEDLIQSFRLALHQAPEIPWRLLLVGDGPDMPKYKNLVNTLKLESRVKFAGFISHEETITYYNRMKVFVALSKSESFGVAVLEAAACGIPAIVSNVGGLPEVLEHGKSGYLVERDKHTHIASLLIELATKPNLRKELSDNAIQFVKDKYVWEDNVKSQIQLYQHLLAE